MQVQHGIYLSPRAANFMHLTVPTCTKPKRNTEFSGCRLSVHKLCIIARIRQQVTMVLWALKLPQADLISV